MVLTLWVALRSGAGWALDQAQSLDAIRQAAADYLAGQNYAIKPTINVAAPDPRLRLPPCASPLEAFAPPGQRGVGTTSVGVRCAGPTPWTVYVQATVALLEQVLVTTHPITRGATLGTSDVQLDVQDVSRLSQGYLTDLKEVDGMIARRSIPAGTVLNLGLVQAPKVVRRGETVILLARASGMEIRMEGRAMSDGAIGDVIRVRNVSSGRVVEGTVVSPGVVEVRF